MTKITVLQKDNVRYSFIQRAYEDDTPWYTITREQCYSTGSSLSYMPTTKESGNKFYKELLEDGFKQFRNVREVSWYATVTDRYTPYEEEWKVEGRYLIPMKSRGVTFEEV